jgi:seryl-tRNA synthetase
LRELSETIRDKQKVLSELEEKRENLLLFVPNIPQDDIPVGRRVVQSSGALVGEPRKFEFTPLPHWIIGAQLGILDFERARKCPVRVFPYLWEPALA